MGGGDLPIGAGLLHGDDSFGFYELRDEASASEFGGTGYGNAGSMSRGEEFAGTGAGLVMRVGAEREGDVFENTGGGGNGSFSSAGTAFPDGRGDALHNCLLRRCTQLRGA